MSSTSRRLVVPLAFGLCACTMTNPAFDDEVDTDYAGDTKAEAPGDGDPNTGDGDPSTGDGDGDPSTSTTGDGDGDPSTSTTGDGDGDPSTTGDGDGEPTTTGDGDGDPMPCLINEKLCQDSCVDIQEDLDNCGECGVTCLEGQLCTLGLCKTKKNVFVTSAKLTGGFGGKSEADGLCQDLASGAQLPGQYKAWLSDANGAPAQTFNKLGIYARTDGVVIAHTWAELIDGQLDAPISLDENAEPVPPSTVVCGSQFGVWTGTQNNGTAADKHCDSWTVANNFDILGMAGRADVTMGWSAACTPACATELSLFCVQQ